MWSVSLKHYKCKEDSSGSYIIHDGRLRAGYARVVTRQGVEWRKMTKNTLQYFEDEADYRLLLVSMQVSIIILILRAESPILEIIETPGESFSISSFFPPFPLHFLILFLFSGIPDARMRQVVQPCCIDANIPISRLETNLISTLSELLRRWLGKNLPLIWRYVATKSSIRRK